MKFNTFVHDFQMSQSSKGSSIPLVEAKVEIECGSAIAFKIPAFLKPLVIISGCDHMQTQASLQQAPS